MKKKKKISKARSGIVELQEERGGLNKREGENWQRKGLSMSPSGIKLSRSLFKYNLVNLAAAWLQDGASCPLNFIIEMMQPVKEKCKWSQSPFIWLYLHTKEMFSRRSPFYV